MAKFYQTPSGDTGLREFGLLSAIEPPIPAGAAVVEFDPATNSGLIDSLNGKNGFRWQDHSIVGGQIVRAGTPVTINPPRVLTDLEALEARTIALALVVLDAVNELRQWDMALKAAFANNSTIGPLRTAVAALPNTPDRTRAQLIAAVRSKRSEV